MSVSLRLFGPFQALAAGQPLARGERRASEHLLALLALAPQASREQLAACLWPESREDRASFYLRRTLMELRGLLGEHAPCIVTPPDARRQLALQLPLTACDLWRFDEALRRGDDTTAVGLYTGPLLEGWSQDWVLAARSERQQQFLLALERLATAAQTGEQAVEQLRRIVALDPTRESAWRALMTALARRGDPGAVVQAFRELRLYLQKEVQVSPSPETLACYERLRSEARRRGEPAPERLLSPSLPKPRTPLVGRQAALETIGTLLASTSLLTLVGIGGVGKTRLALATLEQAQAKRTYAAGVAWVDLAVLPDPSLLRSRIAAALPFPEKESLATQLGERHLLLVLDNCEHLVEGVAALVHELLGTCPHLRILTTSREPLGIPGETLWRVPPLAEADAVQLFSDRARQVQSEWQLTPENHARVAQLCHRLDDLALAIELAAARIAALPLEELLRRLDDRFTLLTGGSRIALPRQQTLHAAMTWSWDLLTSAERSALRQLALFVSHFSLDAAEATCDQGVAVLSALVAKSLLAFDPSTSRYRLLETVREYVLERGLGEEGHQARRRHLRYTLSFLKHWEQCAHGPESRRWTERLATSHDNIRVALTFALEQDPRAALELTGRLWRFWVEYGYRREGLRHLAAALSQAGELPPALLIRPHLGAGALAYETGDFEGAFLHLERALALAQHESDPWAEGEAHRLLGLAHWNQSRIPECQAHYAQSLACFRRAESVSGQASLLACQGHLAWNLGDHAEATRCNQESQELYRALGDEAGIAETSAHLGLIARSQGDFKAARPYFEEALAIRRRLGLRVGVGALLHHIGALAYFEKDLERAQCSLEESIALWRELGDPGWTALSLYFLGLVFRMQRRWDAALPPLLEARAIRRAQNVPRSVAALQFALGTVWLEQGKLREAREALRESSLLRAQIGLPAFCSEALDALAAVHSRLGEHAQSIRVLSHAARVREGHGELEEEHPYREEAERVGRGTLSPESYQAAWAAGQEARIEALLQDQHD